MLMFDFYVGSNLAINVTRQETITCLSVSNNSFKPILLREPACFQPEPDAMRKTALKLGISLAAMPLSIVLLGLTHNTFFFLSFLAGLLFSVLYWLDLAGQIRDQPNPSRAGRTLAVLMAVPQALFGLLCAFTGLAVVLWVLYNTFVDRQPQYTGGFMALGIGPMLFVFGAGWVVTAFRRDAGKSDDV